jgi:heme o synthase
MSTATATAATRAASSPLAYARDLLLLSKPRLSGLVVLTCAGGVALAPGEIGVARAILTVLGTAAVVGAANALNSWVERDVDARMRRTRDRPLPAGRVEPVVALALGVMVPAFALPVLALAANRLTALLAFVALVTDVAIYTPMKKRSTLALFVGAVPGAIPPLMGWTAVTGRMDAGGLALFALLFAWQLPHFLAISLYLAEDYARGGLRVFALVHGERATRAWIAATSVLLVPVALLPVALGLAGPAYAAVAGLSGAALAAFAVSGLRGEGGRWARAVFLATIAWLPVVFAALTLLPR